MTRRSDLLVQFNLDIFSEELQSNSVWRKDPICKTWFCQFVCSSINGLQQGFWFAHEGFRPCWTTCMWWCDVRLVRNSMEILAMSCEVIIYVYAFEFVTENFPFILRTTLNTFCSGSVDGDDFHWSRQARKIRAAQCLPLKIKGLSRSCDLQLDFWWNTCSKHFQTYILLFFVSFEWGNLGNLLFPGLSNFHGFRLWKDLCPDGPVDRPCTGHVWRKDLMG